VRTSQRCFKLGNVWRSPGKLQCLTGILNICVKYYGRYRCPNIVPDCKIELEWTFFHFRKSNKNWVLPSDVIWMPRYYLRVLSSYISGSCCEKYNFRGGEKSPNMPKTGYFKIFFSFTLLILCLHFSACYRTLHQKLVEKIWLTFIYAGRLIDMCIAVRAG
jgi:hypothetical protein